MSLQRDVFAAVPGAPPDADVHTKHAPLALMPGLSQSDMSPRTPIRVWGNAMFDGNSGELDSAHTTSGAAMERTPAAHPAAQRALWTDDDSGCAGRHSPDPSPAAVRMQQQQQQRSSSLSAGGYSFGGPPSTAATSDADGAYAIAGAGGSSGTLGSFLLRPGRDLAPSPSMSLRTGALEAWHTRVVAMLATGAAEAASQVPAPSTGGLVRCRLTRSRGLLSGQSFSLALEAGGGNGPLLVARKLALVDKGSRTGSAFAIAADAAALKGVSATQLSANFVGTDYVLTSGSGVQRAAIHFGHAGASAKGCPRTLHAALPLPEAGGWSCADMDLAGALAQARRQRAGRPDRRVAMLASRLPDWDAENRCYTLEFTGRDAIASSKNLQLACWDAEAGDDGVGSKVVLQLTKLSSDEFGLDFAYPMCVQTALAVALATADDKLCYTMG